MLLTMIRTVTKAKVVYATQLVFAQNNVNSRKNISTKAAILDALMSNPYFQLYWGGDLRKR